MTGYQRSSIVSITAGSTLMGSPRTWLNSFAVCMQRSMGDAKMCAMPAPRRLSAVARAWWQPRAVMGVSPTCRVRRNGSCSNGNGRVCECAYTNGIG